MYINKIKYYSTLQENNNLKRIHESLRSSILSEQMFTWTVSYCMSCFVRNYRKLKNIVTKIRSVFKCKKKSNMCNAKYNICKTMILKLVLLDSFFQNFSTIMESYWPKFPLWINLFLSTVRFDFHIQRVNRDTTWAVSPFTDYFIKKLVVGRIKYLYRLREVMGDLN